MERYLRHDLIDWFDQEHLKRAHALVVGAGAVGNEVIKNLTLLGVGAITVIDFDSIEIHNLTRSVLFSENDIGRYKADVAAEGARRLDPNCQVKSIVGDIWDSIDFATLRTCTVVFSCVDGFMARIRINQLCNLLGVDLINAGIDSRFVSAEIFPFMRDPDAGCYECTLPPSVYQRISERFSCGWLRKVAFEEKKVPTTAITASFAGALATSLFLYSFRDDVESGARRAFLDTVTLATSVISLPKDSMCACCGSRQKEQVTLKAKRSIDGILADILPMPDAVVTVSDPILVSWDIMNCSTCGPAREVVFALASDFSDADTSCNRCGLMQRLANIRDQFTMEELSEFRGKNLPGKFVTAISGDTQILIELFDGEKNE